MSMLHGTRRRRLERASALTLLVASGLASGLALAQPTEPAADEAPEGPRLEDITVTATKREQSVREIPATINALHGEDLEKMGARELQDYITLVPGITLQDSEGSNGSTRKLTVRGVGPGGENTSFVNGNQTVGLFIGDVPMTDPYSNFIVPDLDPFDLKSVEVLKGPQGTTFGASALNGAVRYVPNDPQLDSWEGRGFINRLDYKEGGAGNSYGLALNAPLGETAALRGVGVLQNAPGLIDNVRRNQPDADSRRKWSGRGSLLWQPLERFKFGATWLKQQTHTDDVIYSTDPGGHYLAGNSPGPGDMRGGFSLGMIDTRYDLGDLGELVLQSSEQRKSLHMNADGKINGGTGLQLVRAVVDIGTLGHTHELRLVSPSDGDWSWILGAFVQNYSADVHVDLPVANTTTLADFPGNLLGALFPNGVPGALLTENGLSLQTSQLSAKAGERSLFGELTRKFGKGWEAAAGLRYYRTDLEGLIRISGVAAATYAAGSQRNIEQNNRGYSPRLSLKWNIDDGLMAYAAIARGFQFGGVNAPPLLSAPQNNPVTGVPVPPSFRSSKLWSRELGLRSDWLQRTLRADLTVFDLDWSDAQFNQYAGGLLNNGYIDNVGKVRSQGIETSATWLTPLAGLSLNLASAYTRARTAADYDDGSGAVVPAGSEVPATPKVQAAGTAAYNTLFGPWVTGAALTQTWTGPAYGNLRHEYEIFDYSLLNLNLTLCRPDWLGMPTLTLGVSNLTDERAVLNYTAPAATGVPSWSYSKPRTLSMTLSADFN